MRTRPEFEEASVHTAIMALSVTIGTSLPPKFFQPHLNFSPVEVIGRR